MQHNTLYYGDNLLWMEQWGDELVDLIYLDPPFNSKEDYNLLYKPDAQSPPVSAKAFEDTWRWGAKAVEDRDAAMALGNNRLSIALDGFNRMLGATGMFAYLCHLAPRLCHMRRLLKPGGSLYLHCDDSASHYIKVLMDAVFGPNNYRNQIIWKRATAHNDPKRFGRILDTILLYSKGDDWFWDGDATAMPRPPEEIKKTYPYSDEHGRYYIGDLTGPLHKTKEGNPSTTPWRDYDVHARGRCWSVPKIGSGGKYAKYIAEHFISDYAQIESIHERLEALDAAGLIVHPKDGVWPGLKRYAFADSGSAPQNLILAPIGFTNYSKGEEYTGYKTQKPEALLRKLMDAACPPGGVVLDPYCGCGTTVHVAQATKRPWIGIDLTHLSIAIIEHRFIKRMNRKVKVVGRPEDMAAARDLMQRDPFQFEAWAVSLIAGLFPNERKTGDRGIDGRGYIVDGRKRHLIIAQVKGGKKIQPSVARELNGTIDNEGAMMGVLIAMEPSAVSQGVKTALAQGQIKIDGKQYPKLQLFTIADYFAGRLPAIPPLVSTITGRAPDLVDQANGA